MKYRTLGKTGKKVSELGFGGWAIGGNQFGNSYGNTNDTESKSAILAALEAGVSLFDTADIYGRGHSEALIGEALKEWDGPQPTVITKGGINFYRNDDTLEPDWTPYGIAHSVQQSLIRLRAERIDIFLLMTPNVEELDRWKAWETLEALQRAGKIEHYGVSVADPADGVWLIRNRYPVSVLEVAYSIFMQGATVELLDLARKHKVGIVAREPLANSFLSGGHSLSTEFPEGDMRRSLPVEYRSAMVDTAEKLKFLVENNSRTMSQAALRFVLDDDRVASTVVGIKTVDQLNENLGALSLNSIAPHHREQIMEVFD